MNKFEIGEWVHIKTAGLNGKITNILISNCYPEKYIYTIDICIGGVVHLSGDIPEFNLQPLTENCDEIDCCDCCGCGVCEDSDCKNNKVAENLDNDKKFILGDLYDPDEDEKETIEEIAYDRYIQYESRKLAWEKYKVPMGWKE